MIVHDTFRLLAELESNNNRPWFTAHRDEIQQKAVLPLTAVLEQATAGLASTDLPMSGGRQTLQRIYRDIRFAANKAPYKTSVSGLMTPDGSKSPYEGVAYLQIDARGGHMSAGYYNVKPPVLTRMRRRIVENPDAFRKVLDALGEHGLALTDEMALTGMPKGYAGHSHTWYAEFLKCRVFLVRTRLT